MILMTHPKSFWESKKDGMALTRKVTILSRELSEKERIWEKIKTGHEGQLVVGEKIKELTFDNVILYNVRPIKRIDDLFECTIDRHLVTGQK